MAMLLYEDRLAMPAIDLLFEELTELKIMKGNRVDHPRKSSKDLADAVCGSVFGAISHTPRDLNLEIEVHTWSGSTKAALDKKRADMVELEDKNMPDDVRDFLSGFNLI
jgi:hypothetical protein